MPELSSLLICCGAYSIIYPANKEPFLNQLAGVILVHNWYRSTSTCFHVYSREYTCTSLTRVVLGHNWYGFTGTCHHVKKLVISRETRIDTPNLSTESGEFT